MAVTVANLKILLLRNIRDSFSIQQQHIKLTLACWSNVSQFHSGLGHKMASQVLTDLLHQLAKYSETYYFLLLQLAKCTQTYYIS
ncbi:hypothetical protein CHS0354_011517 [Potamilus streckersoni]|uniref:Uncharacterized protein n=1 Tax=Potamilus streckersoni TaxID=2493646 RepID=A0AAE0SLH6_9BIVA|nr:hypothetical protein CHS0354_011517 [Potamilus streckersoni]